MSARTTEPTANSITHDLLLEIPRRFPARCWRQNTGAAKDKRGQVIRFGRPGISDILGVVTVRGVGAMLAVEVKAGRDTLTPAQESFGRMVAKHGGVWVVARSVRQALVDIEDRLIELGGVR